MGLSQSTVAGIIARLESKELIKKGIVEGDGRKSLLLPTPQGLNLEDTLKETALETQQYITSGMNEREKEEFDRLLQIALDNLNNMRMGR